MIPSILMMRIGPGRGIPIPLPLFLLWPFVLLAGILIGMAYLVALLLGIDTTPFAKAKLVGRILLDLHGLKIDVRSHDGMRVYFWII